jgi:hypothetical protein
MKHWGIAATAALGLVLGLAFSPESAFADGLRSGSGFNGRPGASLSPPARPFGRHRFARPFAPLGLIGAVPIIVGAPPADFGSMPTSSGPPITYDVPPPPPPPARTVSVAPAPPPPPTPSIVQYSHGRYELRGDGVTSAYVWVWVPNPPPPPPVAPRTSGAPVSPTAGDARSEQSGHYFRWIDDQGILNVTDRLDAIPPQYRTRAVRT